VIKDHNKQHRLQSAKPQVPKFKIKIKKKPGAQKERIYNYEDYMDQQEVAGEGLSSEDYLSMTKSARKDVTAFERIM